MSEQGPAVFSGRYELLRHIARGGMADVYLARDQLLDRQVALKVLFPEFANDPSFVERFRREAQAAANLNHPNIVGIYDWGQERGTYYIVMEHVSGRSIADVLRSTGPLSPDRAAEIAADVAGALGTAHAAGVVHRDVKPGNILVSDDGVVKVTDFGIATALAGRGSADLTEHGSVMGTATYFSPEQAQGKALDGRSDLYSLGVVLYQMVAGKPPFEAETVVAMAYRHVQDRPETLRSRGVNIAESLDAITMKLLAKSPANRYPTAGDLRSDLRRYLSGAHKVSGTRADETQTAAPVGGPAETPPGVPPSTPQPPGGGGTDPYGYYFAEPPRAGGGAVWRTVALITALAVLVAVLGFLIVAFVRAIGGEASDPAALPDPAAVFIDVPNLIGDEVQAARESLIELGLGFDARFDTNATVPANEVFDQSPPAGQRAEPGAVVVLTVSSGTEQTVPNVIGETQESATTILQELGYAVQVANESSPQEAGKVIGQIPGAGAALAPGESVGLTVSRGPQVVVIPRTEGMTILGANSVLNAAGFNVSTDPIEEAHKEIEEGKVIRTEPAVNTLVAAGAPVSIVVSSGFPQVSVPELVGFLVDSAQTSLLNVELAVALVFEDVEEGSSNAGRVTKQVPSAFENVDTGSEVTLTVGQVVTMTTTTTTTTTTTVAPTTTTTTTTTAGD